MEKLSYTIAIATRNRPAALRLSIPRMLEQSRPPAQLIVIDSSDDHQTTVDAVAESVRKFPIDLTILPSERGLTLQRNLSLPLIAHPVVFFPDDDSIWFPDVAAAQLEVYERDVDLKIAAVCGAESANPPADWHLLGNEAYRMRRSHRLQQRFATLRAKLENSLVPDPARVLGRSFWPPHSDFPDWFAEMDVVPVEWMTGFRMSFRTEVIRRVRFDEALTRYSLFEDIDASFGTWKHGWVVGARKARIYHYRSPENRDNGRRLGAGQLLNKAYVVAKHSKSDSPAGTAMRKFGHYKVLQYRIAARNAYGRDRYRGALAASREMMALFDTELSRLPQAYQNALRQCSALSRSEESPTGRDG